MKGTIQYKGDDLYIRELLTEYGLKYLRTLKSLKRIVFKYGDDEELNAVAMAMKAKNLDGLTLEKKIYAMEVRN